MRTSCSVFVIATVIQVISGQETAPPPDGPSGPHSANNPVQGPLFDPYQERIPRHCWAPPGQIHPLECCPIPHLFSDEVTEACGIEKPPRSRDPPKGHPDPECKNGKCLMKAAKLVKDDDDESVDYEKLGAFIDNWAKSNPDFEEAIQKAKPICVKEGGPEKPPNNRICVENRIFSCFTANILWNCKLRQDLEPCRVLQDHMNECRPYYEKPKEQDSRNVKLYV